MVPGIHGEVEPSDPFDSDDGSGGQRLARAAQRSLVAVLGGRQRLTTTLHVRVTGLFFGLLDGRSIEEALRLGWAHGALVTTFPGDTTMATLDEVTALASGASSRIQR